MRVKILKWVVLFIAFSLAGSACLAADLPFRKDYPDVKTIETEELKAGYDEGTFIIVDVRSSLEYDVIRVKGAFHVTLSDAEFVQNLKTLAMQYPNKKIAVYCNGGTCLKSYKAATDAMESGLSNVYAYDAGIPDWTNKYPSETLLLGKAVTDPKKQLIPKSELEKRTVNFEEFKRRAAEPDSVAIDTRDPIQRTQKLPGFERALPIPLDKIIKNVINKGNLKDKQLLIFDQVGKQVRWLMYYLVDQGYTNYYFLEGGATSVLKEQQYR